MRKPDFPFAKYRDWGEVPQSVPVIDVDVIPDLTDWQDKYYKRPILDDITGYYQFFPSENGASAYVTRATRNNPVNPKNVAEDDNLEDKKNRQVEHIASSAELATALFWTTAVVRHDYLGQTLKTVTDYPERTLDADSIAKYAADAIADYGYCMENPLDIDIKGVDSGPALKYVIERVARGVGKSLLAFGNYAVEDPDVLKSYEGKVAMQATLIEQERRWNHWSPRHEAITKAFPLIPISNEVLYQTVNLDEMFWMHEQVKVA